MPYDTQHSDAARERLARRRAAAKMGWLIHALVYVCVNAGLALVAWHTGRAWHLYPLAGWGLGLAIHGLVTFIALQGDGLRGRMLDDEIRRLREREGGGQGGGR